MLFSCRSKAKGRTARGACPGERLRAGRDAGGGRGARAAGEADCGEGEARDGRAARRRARRGRAPGRGAACPELLRTPGRGAEKLPAAPSCRESPPAARFWPNADRGSARRGAGPVYADLEAGIAAGGRDSGQMPTGVAIRHRSERFWCPFMTPRRLAAATIDPRATGVGIWPSRRVCAGVRRASPPPVPAASAPRRAGGGSPRAGHGARAVSRPVASRAAPRRRHQRTRHSTLASSPRTRSLLGKQRGIR